jgi:hypothetical protein
MFDANSFGPMGAPPTSDSVVVTTAVSAVGVPPPQEVCPNFSVLSRTPGSLAGPDTTSVLAH